MKIQPKMRSIWVSKWWLLRSILWSVACCSPMRCSPNYVSPNYASPNYVGAKINAKDGFSRATHCELVV